MIRLVSFQINDDDTQVTWSCFAAIVVFNWIAILEGARPGPWLQVTIFVDFSRFLYKLTALVLYRSSARTFVVARFSRQDNRQPLTVVTI